MKAIADEFRFAARVFCGVCLVGICFSPLTADADDIVRVRITGFHVGPPLVPGISLCDGDTFTQDFTWDLVAQQGTASETIVHNGSVRIIPPGPASLVYFNEVFFGYANTDTDPPMGSFSFSILPAYDGQFGLALDPMGGNWGAYFDYVNSRTSEVSTMINATAAGLDVFQSITLVPEPGSVSLVSVGLAALVWVLSRRNKNVGLPVR